MNLNLENKIKDWLFNSGVFVQIDNHLAYGSFRSSYDISSKSWLFYYSEITGYALSLFCLLYKKEKEKRYIESAKKSAAFLLKYQIRLNESPHQGSFPEGLRKRDKSIMNRHYTFDTAMCIQGLMDFYEIVKDDKILQSAINAGDWLVSMQLESGAFLAYYDSKTNISIHPGSEFHLDEGCLHAKHAIALYKLYNVTKDIKYKNAAVKVCNWVITLQSPDGSIWVNENKSYVYSHAHCYALEGLIYAYSVNKDSSFKEAILKGSSWLKKNINKRYSGILGSHKINPQFDIIEKYTKRKYLKTFRKYFPRLEIATDASFQAARILLYMSSINNNKEDQIISERIINNLIPFVIADKPIFGIHSRLDISLFWPRKTPFISTWGMFFALHALILKDSIKNNSNMRNLKYLF